MSIYSSAPMLLFFGLFLEHLIIDFPLQTPYQYLNKGTYGHPGGLLHSLLHLIGTALVVVIILGTEFWFGALMMGVVDGVLHYHIDWAKVKMTKYFGWAPTTHEQYWWLLGVDQFLHMLTYWMIVGFIIVGRQL